MLMYNILPICFLLILPSTLVYLSLSLLFDKMKRKKDGSKSWQEIRKNVVRSYKAVN